MEEGLTGKHLEEFGQKHCKNFLGVFSCDLYPDISKRKIFSVIFNESKHDEKGTHFVCLYAKTNVVYYFDSLGLKCENEYILKFINSTRRRVIEVGKQIQSFDSIFCGYFSISFIMYMCNNLPYKKYVNLFCDANLKLNDKIVVELIIELINK